MGKKKKNVCMVVPNPKVKGGIAAVINGYMGSSLEQDYNIKYVESYMEENKMKKLVKGICGYFNFAKTLIVNKPDLIHIHSSFGPSFYRKIPFIYMASLAKKPIINHIHGADFETFFINANDRKKRLIKRVYNKCSILVALSEEWKEKLSSIVPEEKIKVVENYSILKEDAMNARLNRTCNKKILFLGEIGKRKGCYDIPPIAKKINGIFPEVEFVIAGSGEVENLKSILSKKGLDKNVIFPGWVRDDRKDKLLRECDIFFLPSYNEGMPMSILDAMGYGLPIVSTNVGGITKIVLDGENGYICSPGDVDGFVDKLAELIGNEQTIKTFGLNSFNLVKNNYSIEQHIKKFKQIYNSQL